MGQQQILLLVLSVVIIATTIAVSADQFNNKIKTSNRKAIIQDMYNLACLAIAFSKTPASFGGGGGDWDADRFYAYCSYPISNNGKYIETSNGRIQVSEISKGRLRIKGWGNEIGFDDKKAIRARLFLSGTGIEDMAFKILN
ncbi:MAG: hypothetical protein DRI23_09170 [Candidatus Cloacimonadota bacterium]|nr:MAG: hypothetical protein DRI23_09170 [Candidatus Cloacimonadota bacterium]RLC49929.1 MAG: hypothetical protein DRH79_08360 [Candidatus Cloacimonadota bacterium]